MEKLRKNRKQLRRALTAHCKKICDALNDGSCSDVSISGLLAMLEDKGNRLFLCDEEICKLIPDEEDLEQVFDEAEHYRELFLDTKNKCLAQNSNSHVQIQRSGEEADRNYKLPKLTLCEFDVSARQWLAFWGQYSRIHDDPSLPREDKFQYLLMSLKKGTKARAMVENFPPSADNYDKAVEVLTSRFGREETLIELYTRDLIQLVVNKPKSISDLYDNLNSKLKALSSLGVTSDRYAAMLLPLVESSLPVDLLKVWERSRNENLGSRMSLSVDASKLSDVLDSLIAFLEAEVLMNERVETAQKALVNLDVRSSTRAGQATVGTFLSQVNTNVRCILCSQEHVLQCCKDFLSMSVVERSNLVKRERLCFNCFRSNHAYFSCRDRNRCSRCQMRHSELICDEMKPKSGTEGDPKFKQSPTVSSCIAAVVSRKEVNLRTVCGFVCLGKIKKLVRILLDPGSQRSYIKSDLIESYPHVAVEIISQGVFGGQYHPARPRKIYEIMLSSRDGGFKAPIRVLAEATICPDVEKINDHSILKMLKNRGIELSDCNNDSVSPEIGLLIGQDFEGFFLTGKTEIFSCGIVAVETKLGWAAGGPVSTLNGTNHTVCNLNLNKFWSLDMLGIQDPVQVLTRQEVEDELQQEFDKSVKWTGERYQVKLPWRAGHPPLRDNLAQAVKRLTATSKKLENSGQLLNYNSVFKEWEESRIIEKCGRNEFDHFIPHRPVFKQGKPPRPVYDASKGGSGLNECLATGPNLLRKIPPLLTRFRLGKFGVSADIAKAFLMIEVEPADRKYLKFVWWDDISLKNICYYRFNRVLFGLVCSPFLLNATIHHHLENVSRHLDTANNLKESFYADDCLYSTETVEQLQKFVMEASETLREGGFELRDWVSNFENMRNGKIEHKVVGVPWNLKDDTLGVVMNFPKVIDIQHVTKRLILSVVSKLYDPLGMLAAVTLVPKRLLQEAWINKVPWDAPLPFELSQAFVTWVTQFNGTFCNVPRWLGIESTTKQSLHMFSDASATSYAACVFLRSESVGKVKVNFVISKAKLAPLPRTTMPRLELLGACIGVRLLQNVKEAFPSDIETHCWVDASIVLSWIKFDEPWNTFVGNRVREIRQFTSIEQWRHVPGNMNPSDILSRGSTMADLVKQDWWDGPHWLRRAPEEWPDGAVQLVDDALVERKKTTKTFVVISGGVSILKRFERISSYLRSVRVIAWILRAFGREYFTKQKSGILSTEEVMRAELLLLKMVQGESDLSEISTVKTYLGEDGLLRVAPRNATLCDSLIVLPANHSIIERLVMHEHCMSGHGGVGTTLCKLRERFWIIRGRICVKRVLKNCGKCRRFFAKAGVPPPAPLPDQRVDISAAVFENSAVDLFGPMMLRDGSKRWGVLFTCLVYRAVHLDMVKSLSTECFLMALRRFQARRTKLKFISSDRGTNFVGVQNLINAIDWDQVNDFMSSNRIIWRTHPGMSPWYNGVCERLVRLVKEILVRNVGQAALAEDELYTVLCECERVVNSRPLTYVSNEPDDWEPITPSSFLLEKPNSDINVVDIIENVNYSKRIRYVRRVREQLRDRFKKEYLNFLVFSGENVRERLLNVGDVVLIHSDQQKKVMWPLGRICELYSSKDGGKRVARVKTSTGELIRPLQRLYPLEGVNHVSGKAGVCQDVDKTDFNSDPSLNVSVTDETGACPDIDETALYNETALYDDPSVRSPTASVQCGPIIKTSKGRHVKRPVRLDL